MGFGEFEDAKKRLTDDDALFYSMSEQSEDTFSYSHCGHFNCYVQAGEI